MRHLLISSAALTVSLASLFSAPIANPDSGYGAFEDVPTLIPAPGVLANDDPNGAPGIVAAKVTNPSNGTVTLNADGSFLYTGNPNYFGPDSFTYKAVESPGPITFTVDQPNSVLSVNVRSQTYFVGGTSDNQTRNAQVSGTVSALVVPTTSPFNTIQIQSLNLSLAQAVSMTVCVQRIIFCTASLTASIAPGGLVITMSPSQAGPPVSVGTGGTFNQTGNRINTNGTVNLSGSGLAGLIEVPPSAALDSTDQPFDFNGGTITQTGSTLVLTVPLDITQAFSESGDLNNPGNYKVTVRVTGTIRATAPVPPPPAESAPVSVSLVVEPVNDRANAVNDRYYTRQNHTINIPATAVQTNETLIAQNSLWKYSTGSNLGTSWRDPHYNDSTWAAANGVLGYGDPDITGSRVIPGGNVNPRPPVAYFRRTFTLTAPFDTVQPQVEFQRDDACVVFLNGREIYRDSTPYTTGGAAPLPASGEIPYGYAGASIEPDSAGTVYKSVPFSRQFLWEGTNTVAVAVYQASSTSSDLRFDLRANRTRGVAGLLSNDTDLENDVLTAEILTAPASGASVTINSNGSFTYTPPLGFTGTDTFAYQVKEGGILYGSPVALVPRNSTWKFLSPTSDQNTAWRAPAFNDAAWSSGPGPLGYGNADIGASSTLSFGSDPANKPLTYYFRRTFTLPSAKELHQSLHIYLRVDDGAAIYLNGTEVVRHHLSGELGDDTVTYNTPANTRVGTTTSADYMEYEIPSTVLVNGTNTIAVEVHQFSPDSSDLVFDLELQALQIAGALVTVEVLNDDADNDDVSDTWERAFALNPANPADANQDPDGDGQNNRAEFLAGTDPRQSSSVFKMLGATPINAGNLTLHFTSVAGKRYQVQSSNTLSNWADLGQPTAPATGASFSALVPAAQPRLFYRMRILDDWR